MSCGRYVTAQPEASLHAVDQAPHTLRIPFSLFFFLRPAGYRHRTAEESQARHQKKKNQNKQSWKEDRRDEIRRTTTPHKTSQHYIDICRSCPGVQLLGISFPFLLTDNIQGKHRNKDSLAQIQNDHVHVNFVLYLLDFLFSLC